MATTTATQDPRKLALAAQRKARKIAGDQSLNRSTRQRRALRVKADALDQIASVTRKR